MRDHRMILPERRSSWLNRIVNGRIGGPKTYNTRAAAVRRTICGKRPEQLKMEFALWTRAAVMQFVEREFGVRLSIRATGEYLRRWGFTPQKPIKRAYEQRPEAVKQWPDQQYPQIDRRAKAEGGEIY